MKQSLKKLSSSLFKRAVHARTNLFDQQKVPIHTVSGLKIISVGNIAVGGRGKTPLAMYIANYCKTRGCKTGILHRGYKGRLEVEGGVVSKGSGPLMSVQDAGDEPFLASKLLDGVNVYVGKNKVRSAHLAKADELEVLILDDGFQHRRLHRDVDIVCISPTDFTSTFLPVGLLREDVEALKRAHLLMGNADEWKTVTDNVPQCLYQVVPTHLLSQDFETVPLVLLENKRVHLVSAIANSNRFHSTVSKLSCTVISKNTYNDHHWYTQQNIDDIQTRATAADIILTTTKDMVKLETVQFAKPIYALNTSIEVISGKELFTDLIQKVLAD